MKISGISNSTLRPSRSVADIRNLNGSGVSPGPTAGQNSSWSLPSICVRLGWLRSGVTVVSMRTWVNGNSFFTRWLFAPYGFRLPASS